MKQKSELTFKHNLQQGRYGWLRLTPAYSLKMVQRYMPGDLAGGKLLDPFGGTATTSLYAAYHGIESYSLELNPFLAWFSRVKTARYDKRVADNLCHASEWLLEALGQGAIRLAEPPPIRNIQRWWRPSALEFLQALKGGIATCQEESLGTPEVIDLLTICFCRTLIKISNAAFNHQSMSFNDDRQLGLFNEYEEYHAIFSADVQFVAASLRRNPEVVPQIVQGDARRVDDYVPGNIDWVITSPPYPNRMSYIRELRPYMYWLGYLEASEEAGELDWQAIGGTWGVATSRLSDWERDEAGGYYPEYYKEILTQIRADTNKHGRKMANYIARYFEDIAQHFESLARVLNAGATAHYIVGNSTFYGVLVPVERLYKELMEINGFTEVKIEPVRKRNSKKELYEFAVSGRMSSAKS